MWKVVRIKSETLETIDLTARRLGKKRQEVLDLAIQLLAFKTLTQEDLDRNPMLKIKFLAFKKLREIEGA